MTNDDAPPPSNVKTDRILKMRYYAETRVPGTYSSNPDRS
jgi:hypothetical protein